MRLFQQRKARVLQLRQVLRLEHHEIAPVLVAAVDAVDTAHQIRNQPFHLGEHAGLMKLNIRGEFLVIIDVDQRDIRHLFFKEALIVRRLGAVEPILKDHRPRILLAVDRHAHHLKNVARELHRHSDQRRLKIKVRLRAADIRLGEYLRHRLVSPGNLSVALDERAGNPHGVDQFRGDFGIFRKDVVHPFLHAARAFSLQRETDEKDNERSAQRGSGSQEPVGLIQPGRKNGEAQYAGENAQRNQAGFLLFHTVAPVRLHSGADLLRRAV
ncbi:hypothetical protein SDC9_147239 [bioreactor metagenome]|uniref:Uncharacterized protein n=1 Tax=bioreactor metagenome TaxID=1076179 RepID=A0A645EDC8_9ZZZZ